MKQNRYIIFKRVIDVLFAFLLLIIFSPIIFIIFTLLLFIQGRPVLFKQKRAGFLGRPFYIYKFRTMKNSFIPIDNSSISLTDSKRVTFFGYLLRLFSLDELPQLWNIINGDMSFIGPRPLFLDYLPLYNYNQSRRHLVKPGISGLAQVNGRNLTTWEERLKLDVMYVDEQGFFIDLKIFFMTIIKIVSLSGTQAEGETSMPPFKGS